MPIYEYDCHDCRRRVSLLVRSLSATATPACPRCGSTTLTRLMSRFATVKSEEARLESLAEGGGMGDLDENDPASVARPVALGHLSASDICTYPVSLLRGPATSLGR